MADELRDLIRRFGTKVKLYCATQTADDPYYTEQHTTTYNNPITIKAMVSSVSAEKAVWKIQGIRTANVKEFVTHKRNKKLINCAFKIEIDGTEYYGKEDNTSFFSLTEDGNYVRCVIWQTQ